MPIYLFWFFAVLMLVGGLAVVAMRNPVSAALAMVASFVGLAGLFIGLNAYFVGIIQILVYAGAVMVLLQRQNPARVNDDALDLKSICIDQRFVRPPGAIYKSVQGSFRSLLLLE